MQHLKLEELLRYGLAGGVGLLAIVLSFHLPASLTDAGFGQASILVAAAMTIGAVTYVVHRALLYPILGKGILCILCASGTLEFDWTTDWKLILPYVPSRLEVRLDFIRWKRFEEKHFAQPALSHWGAQVHFLYCTSWTMLLALWIGSTRGLKPTPLRSVLFWSAGIIAFGAFISNLRLAYYDALLATNDDLAAAPETDDPALAERAGIARTDGSLF
jgi:hypothetical protein